MYNKTNIIDGFDYSNKIQLYTQHNGSNLHKH